MIKFCLLSFCLAKISNIVYRCYNNPKMKSNLNANQKCGHSGLLTERKERSGKRYQNVRAIHYSFSNLIPAKEQNSNLNAATKKL